MHLLHNLFEYLRSDDPNKVAQALDILANSATIAKLVGIDRAARDMIKRILGSISSTPDPKGCNPECLELIHLLEKRVLELEKFHLKAQANIAIKVLQDNIDAKDNINIVRLAIQEAIISEKPLIESNDLNHLPNGGQRNRFLYLASNNYADSMNTLNFAIHNNFLWRSYFANLNRRTNVYQQIGRVEKIQNGDIIVLAFRENGHFKVLSPLVVTGPFDGMTAIAGMNGIPVQSPFVSVQNCNLNTLLAGIGGYGPDPNLGVRTGLPVKLLNTNFSTPEAINVYNTLWPSPPGINTLWIENGQNANGEFYLHQQVRNWINTL